VLGLVFNGARPQPVADPARFLFAPLEPLRQLRRVDPATVPGAGGLYAGAIGIWSLGGISFDIGARFLRLADRYVDRDDRAERYLYRMMDFAHHWLVGDWDPAHEISLEETDAAIRAGQLWDVATHFGLEGSKLVAQGRFAEAGSRVERCLEMEEAYAYDLARSNRHAITAFLHTERRDLDRAAAAAETYLTEHQEPLLNLLALGTKSKVEVLRGDLERARATLATADRLLAQGRVPPLHLGFCARSHLRLSVADLEQGRPAPRLRRSIRDAAWAAQRVAWLRPEVHRLVGRAYWLEGRRRRALAEWSRGLAEAERLGAAPEAARTRAEMARRAL